MRTGFEDKENGKISSAVGLSKCSIDIIARDISLFSETNPRAAEQDLTRFPYSYAMLCCKFIFNRFWTNDVLNMNGRDPFIALMIRGNYILDHDNSEEKNGAHQPMFGASITYNAQPFST